MAEFTPRNPEFARRVRSSFARQGFMAYLGADLRSVEPGACEIRLPYRDELSQQHRYFHGGSSARWPTTPAVTPRSP